jgi:hypothetical protein
VLAVRAPSIHNTQPWRFRREGNAIEIAVDPDRALPVTDPSGWGVRIAIGAAALNLRLGYASLGWEAEAIPLPEHDRPDVLIRVRPRSRRPQTPQEHALTTAIPLRHTNRRGYLDDPVPGEALSALVEAARAEACWLQLVGPRQTTEVSDLLAAADDELEGRPGYREERVFWSRRDSADGVVPDPFAGPRIPGERLRRRDFGSRTTSPRPYESDPCVAVLGTDGQSAYDDLRAGQALQRVLLTAAEQQLTASMYSQAIKVASARARLADICGRAAPPRSPREPVRLHGSAPKRRRPDVAPPPRRRSEGRPTGRAPAPA